MAIIIKEKRILVGVIAALLITIIARLVHPVFSIYELLLIFYETGCVVLALVPVLIGIRRWDIIYTLKISCLILLGVAGYSTMTYGQASIHGDTAIATLLARAEMSHHSFVPRTWCYANGDVWLLDTQLAVMPFVLLMKDQVAARMMGTLLMMIVGTACIYLLDKYVLCSYAYLIILPVCFVFIFGGNSDLVWGNDHINYQASYTCWLCFIPIMCLLVYRLYVQARFSWQSYALYCMFALVCYARGIRAIAELMLPLAMAYPLFVFFRDGYDALKRWYKYLLFVAPALTGCMIYKYICMTHIVNTSVTSGTAFVSDLETAFENAKIVFINLFRVFGYNEGCDLASLAGLANMVSISCCVLFMFIIPALQIEAYKDEPEGVRFFFLFAMIHNTEMIISTIFFDKTSASHIFTFVLVSIMASSVYIMRHWISNNRRALIYGTIFVAASLIMAAQLGLHSRGWQGRVEEKRSMINEMMLHGLNECKGYGTFWNIYPLSIYSDLRLDVAAIGGSDIALELTPHLNLVDSEKYIPDDRGSYILLDYNENQEMGEELEGVFGECCDKFNIGENYIYVWDYDICENDFSGKWGAE